MLQRDCVQCGKPFEAQRPTAKYCSSLCRTRRARSGPPAPAAPAPARSGQPASGLVDSVRTELEELGALDSVNGQWALELASRIVGAPGMNTGVAALSKELSRVLGEVRQAAPPAVVDPVDQLKARRDAKRAAAC